MRQFASLRAQKSQPRELSLTLKLSHNSSPEKWLISLFDANSLTQDTGETNRSHLSDMKKQRARGREKCGEGKKRRSLYLLLSPSLSFFAARIEPFSSSHIHEREEEERSCHRRPSRLSPQPSKTHCASSRRPTPFSYMSRPSKARRPSKSLGWAQFLLGGRRRHQSEASLTYDP